MALSRNVGASSKPQIPDTIEETKFDLEALNEETAWSDVAIHDATLAGETIRHLSFERSRVSNVNFGDMRILQLHATDVAFSNCNFANMASSGSSSGRVTFSQSKFTGMQLTKARLTDVEFDDCRLDLTTFDDNQLKAVTFQNCLLRDADFSNTLLERVLFINCDLSGATFARMRITDSEMRDCKLKGLRGLDTLRGIAMECSDILENADLFAAELGIRIAVARSDGDE
jgi:uncharacterized protein YjbI with pentapeptide repeats